MVRVNKDGSISVGVLPEEVKTSAEQEEKPAPQKEKKPTKKKN